MTESRYRSRTGITEAEYDRRLKEQGGGCAICGRLPKTRRLHSDHRHKGDEAVRGLLCFSCNRTLPYAQYAKEDWLMAAKVYLKEGARSDGRPWIEVTR